MRRSAIIRGNHRYELFRTWDVDGKVACFVMLNPSTADAEQDDPTVRKCVGFAKRWGCGGVRIVNLFSIRSPSPSAIRLSDSPVGPRCDEHLLDAASNSDIAVAAWGNHGGYHARDRGVLDMLRREGVAVQCLGVTTKGFPRHPLYVSYAVTLDLYRCFRSENYSRLD